MTARNSTPTTRNTGIIAIDPATTDAVGAALLVLIDDNGAMRVQWQSEDLEHLPGAELRSVVDALIVDTLAIANTPGFTR